MRVIQHFIERPIDRDSLAVAFKVPFALHGIKETPSIMLVNKTGAEDILKFARDHSGGVPDSFTIGADTLVLAVPDDKLHNGIIVFMIPEYL